MKGELTDGFGFVLAAYAVVWVVLLAYGASLWLRCRGYKQTPHQDDHP